MTELWRYLPNQLVVAKV
uniref:Uncharacterized protein n=1 Tax=Arundo donax TaxID=35708 RepID=A0A0A8Y4U3_ARUDO